MTERIFKFEGKLHAALGKGIKEVAVDRDIITHYCGADYKQDNFHMKGVLIWDKAALKKEDLESL